MLHNVGDLQDYDGKVGIVESICDKGLLFEVIVEGGDKLCNLSASMLQAPTPLVIKSNAQAYAPVAGAAQMPIRNQAGAVRQLLESLHAQSSTLLD